jgi:MFS family permease
VSCPEDRLRQPTGRAGKTGRSYLYQEVKRKWTGGTFLHIGQEVLVSSTKLWTKDYSLVTCAHLFVSLNLYILIVIVSLFAIDTFRSSPSEAGFASGIFMIGSVISRLLSGKWIERIGRKKTLRAGLVLGLIMTVLYFIVNNVALLFIVRFCHGISSGITLTAMTTIVSYTIPRERHGEGIGIFMLSLTLAMAIGPFLGIFVSRYAGFHTCFAICAICTAAGLVSALFLNVPEIRLTHEQLEETKGLRFESFFEVKAIPISVISGIACVCYSSITSFLAPYAREINLTNAAGFFFVVYAAASFFSRPYCGRLFDSRGENFTMYPALLAFMIGMFVLGHAHFSYTLLLAAVFVGFGFGVEQSSAQAIAVRAVKPHRLGVANSTFFAFVDVGSGIGPFIWGLFVPFTGFGGLYKGLAVILLACTFLYHVLHGRMVALKEA